MIYVYDICIRIFDNNEMIYSHCNIDLCFDALI